MGRWPNEDAYDPVIKASVDSMDWYGLNKDQVFAFLKSIVAKESSFNPKAMRGEAGGNASIGLMQVLFSTAKGLGYPGEVGDPNNLSGLFAPGTNVFIGTKFVRQLLDRTGPNLDAIASAYNGGYRPTIGFGAKLTKPVRLCLARDTAGNCIRYYDAKAGEFGNQPYVDAVLHNYAYFFRAAPPIGEVNVPQQPSVNISPPSVLEEAASSPVPWAIILVAGGLLAFFALRGGGR